MQVLWNISREKFCTIGFREHATSESRRNNQSLSLCHSISQTGTGTTKPICDLQTPLSMWQKTFIQSCMFSVSYPKVKEQRGTASSVLLATFFFFGYLSCDNVFIVIVIVMFILPQLQLWVKSLSKIFSILLWTSGVVVTIPRHICFRTRLVSYNLE